MQRKPLLGREAIARASASKNPVTDFPEVHVSFTAEGAQQFAKISRENMHKRLAIIVEGEILLAPAIRMEVDGGTVVISNFWSDEEAKQLAARLNQALRR